jgi:hypothetical protein
MPPTRVPAPTAALVEGRPYVISSKDDDVTKVAHVLLEEAGTTFGAQGMRNVARVIENRITNDPNGEWPDTALGVVSQSNAEGTAFAFVGWKMSSTRGTGWMPENWAAACSIAKDLVNGTPITDYNQGMGNSRWYMSCHTDFRPPWVPVDSGYVQPPYESSNGTMYFYERPFAVDANGMNCMPAPQ